jgi:hypothetical protein
MKRVAKIQDVRSRNNAVKRRSEVVQHILSARDEDEDTSEYEDELDDLDTEVDEFDKKFTTTVRNRVQSQDKDLVRSVQKFLERGKTFGLSPEQMKQLKTDLDSTIEAAKRSNRRIEKTFSSLDDIDDQIEDKKTEIIRLQEEEEDLPAYETIDHWSEIEDLQEDILSLQRRKTALQARMQMAIQEKERILREEQERAATLMEAHEDVQGDEEEEDADAKALLDKAKQLQAAGLKAYKTYISSRIPNDVSIEKDLTKRAQEFLSLEKLAKQIASVYERDAMAFGSILTFGAILGMPGRALGLAMKLNDKEPRVADWRDALPGGSESGQSKEMKRTEADMKKFKTFMQSAEKQYVDLLEYLPTSGKAAKLKDLIGAYKGAMTRLAAVGHKAQEEYPPLAAALDAVAWSGYHHVNMLKKAIS